MRVKLSKHAWDEEHHVTRKLILMDMDAWDLVQSWVKFAYGLRIDREEDDLQLTADQAVIHPGE